MGRPNRVKSGEMSLPVQHLPAAFPKKAPKIAVLIPCLNEATTVGAVIRAFRQELPEAEIYVFDNNSTDATAEIARAEGARVHFERRQGKGYVVQSMFRKVRADVYVMVDGDATYPATAVRSLIEPILDDRADMVVGSRLHASAQSDFRALNRFGNQAFVFALARIFDARLTDLLSGYRAFNSRFVERLPLFSGGFDTEIEMTVRALQQRLRIEEVPVDLSQRPAGSNSKIHIVRDGVLILTSMLALFRDYKPLSFFGAIGLVLIAMGLIPGGIVINQFLDTGLIHRIPSAILAVGLTLSGLMAIVVGIILHTVAQRFRELEFHIDSVARIVGRRDGEA